MTKNITENLKPVIFIVIVLALAAISAYPQRRLTGRVVDVIDGKTCVIELYNKKLTAVLQFIETPDPEQPLYEETKTHLQALVLNKNIEFIPRGVMGDKAIGRLFVKGIDVSQQMLRDGAAWYSVAERTSQGEDESQLYQENETQAKTEKRGVWGVADLVPVWEFRAERAARQRRLEKDEFMKSSRVRNEQEPPLRGATPTKTAPQSEFWANIGAGGENNRAYGVGSLRVGGDPEKKIGFIFTPSILLDFPGRDFLQKAEARIYYGFSNGAAAAGRSVYLIAFVTASKNYKFMQKNDLTVTADNQKIPLGAARRYFRQNASAVEELMVYKVTREQLLKISKAGKISAQMGSYAVVVPSESMTSVKELMDATK
ncbi:MAG TPA: thermonuclease family protein [Pyrinomonadaceae bacterium]|jgi:endonuclease YncB( thermonuclease family)